MIVCKLVDTCVVVVVLLMADRHGCLGVHRLCFLYMRAPVLMRL